MKPTTEYRLQKIQRHDQSKCHAHAVMLDSMVAVASAEGLDLAVPRKDVEQVLSLFRTVYAMAKSGMAHRPLHPMLQLQQLNGVEYNLAYVKRRYVPTVLRFLSLAIKSVFARQLQTSSVRACRSMR